MHLAESWKISLLAYKQNSISGKKHTFTTVRYGGSSIMMRGCFFFSRDRKSGQS